MIIAVVSKTSNCCLGRCNFSLRKIIPTLEKKTLVIGASLKEFRYSNICVKTLVAAGVPVAALGLREGIIDQVRVQTGIPEFKDIHTVTLYLRPENQTTWYDYILKLNPARVIFNPETENEVFENMLNNAGIEVVEDCTLMMVEGGRF